MVALALVFIRSLAGQLLVPVLATLLVLTTPVGAGQGVHQNDLLHPVLQHVHLVNGKVVTDEQMAAARAAAQLQDSLTSTTPVAGPALGAGNGADAAGLGIAVGPTLPLTGFSINTDPFTRLAMVDVASPTEFLDSPEDPPPDSLA